MYSFKIIDSIDEFAQLSIIWNKLLNFSRSDTFFLTHEWLFNWWITFANKYSTLSIVIGYFNSQPVAIAPLMIVNEKSYGFNIKKLKFLGYPQSDTCDFIIHEKHSIDICSPLHEFIMSIPGWEQMHLREIPVSSIWGNWLIKQKKRWIFREDGSECPFIDLSQWESWEDFFRNVSKSTKKKVKNCTNRLNKAAELEICHNFLTDQGTVIFSQAQNLEEQEKAGKYIQLGLTGELENKFQQKIIASSSEIFQVLISSLNVNSKMIAYNFGYLYKNKYYFYNTAYSSEFKAFSPGMLIFANTIKFLIKQKVEEFNCLRGATVSKKRWAKKSRSQLNLYYLKKNIKNLPYLIAVFYLRPFLKNISRWRKKVVF